MLKQRNQVPRGKHGNMKLVLTEDVQHLGKQGDVVEVRPGYGRNYLIPRGMATMPTAHNLRLLERYKIRVRQAKEARIADLRALAAEISKGLRGRNLPVEAEMVRLEGVVKETGLYEVNLVLGTDMENKPIETKVKVA